MALAYHPPNGSSEGSVTCTRNGEKTPSALAFSRASRATVASPTKRLPSRATHRPAYSRQWDCTHACSLAPDVAMSEPAEPVALAGLGLENPWGSGTIVPTTGGPFNLRLRERLTRFRPILASPRPESAYLAEWVTCSISLLPLSPERPRCQGSSTNPQVSSGQRESAHRGANVSLQRQA